MLFSKACVCSRDVLVLEVLVQEGPSALIIYRWALVSEGCLTTSECGIAGITGTVVLLL